MTQAKKFSIKISIHHYFCFPSKSAARIFTTIIFPKLVINAIPKYALFGKNFALQL